MKEKFVAGIVGSPFGLEGFVKVKALSGEINHLLHLETVTLRQNGAERSVNVAGASAQSASSANLIMLFAGYGSPEEAKALAGAEIIVSREDAAPLQPGEFYVEDLKGLAVVAAGKTIGIINSVIEGGSGELVEIKLQNGEMKLVPFRKEFFPGIDLENGMATMDNLWILE